LNILTELSLWLLLFGITFSNSATEIFAVSIIVFFLIKKIALKNPHLPKTSINIPLYVLGAIIFVTFLRSSYFSESMRGFVRIVKFIFLYFALVEFFIEDEKRIKRAFWVLIAVASFTFLNGIFQSQYGFDILRHKEFIKADHLRRISASFVHPNDFASYIIFVLPFSFCFFFKELKRNQKIFLVMNCLIGLYCLLKTSSRAAWLGFLIGLVIYFFYYKRKISILVPLAIILVVAFTPHGIERMTSLFAMEQNTVWERTQLWKGTWEMVKVHPFLGFGVNTFSRYFLEYKPAIYPDIRYTHNSYLQMWSEIGILGLGTFVSIIFIILTDVFRDMREKLRKGGMEGYLLLSLVTGYVAFLIQSAFDTNLYSLVLTTLFWVMNAYLVSINAVVKKKV
jgi:O-antigen ligase